jgi:hypothetical protein
MLELTSFGECQRFGEISRSPCELSRRIMFLEAIIENSRL